MRIHCQEHGYPEAWVGETCPKCQVDILREALMQIARGDTTCGKWTTKLPQWEYVAKEALKKVGGEV